MYLDWHHGGIRKDNEVYFVRKYLSGLVSGKWASEKLIDKAYKSLIKSLDLIV